VSKLDRVNRHYPAITKVALPLLVGILIVDTVLDVVREQIFQFDRRAKPKAQLWIFPPSHSSAMSVRAELRGANRRVISFASTSTEAWKRKADSCSSECGHLMVNIFRCGRSW